MAEIKKYRKPLNLNIGIIIFAAIFIYACFYIATYFNTAHIRPYEVREGSLTSNNLYTGIAIRDEVIVKAEDSGYINYYLKEGGRAANGDLVYSIDETGKLNEYLKQNSMNESSLSDANLAQLKSEIVTFLHGFSPSNYETAYDFKYTVKGNILRMSSNSFMSSIDDLSSRYGSNVKLCYAKDTGVVMYWNDGFEALNENTITTECFDQSKYTKNQYLESEKITAGTPVYKYCNKEEWYLVIPVDEYKANELEEEGYVKVRFMKNQLESWAQVSIFNGRDGSKFAKLLFNNSMITFCNDRFLEVELLLHEETGLKIPNSAIVQREFYLLPEEFVVTNDSNNVVIREYINEEGKNDKETVNVSIYSKVDGEYYVDADVLHKGDRLIKTDSAQTYTVSKSATLIGVYNMNKGYADFRQIEILYQNDEYAIVKSNTDYGLNVYDMIVQEASTVKADQFIYK